MIDEVMKYPEFSGGAFYVFLVLALVALAGYIWLRSRSQKQLGRDIEWNRLLMYGRKRSLDKQELRFLQNFYSQLLETDRTRILKNRPFFRDRLRDYLLVRGEVTARGRVRVFQKLFPEIDYRLEIADSSDLQPGELCSLAGRKRTGLARVREADRESVHLDILDRGREEDFPEGLPSHVIAYRPLLGEFILNGKILERSGRSAVFRYGGKVEARYETHLMLERNVTVRLEPMSDDRSSHAPGSPTAPPAAGGEGGSARTAIMEATGPDSVPDPDDEFALAGEEQEASRPPGEVDFIEGTTDRISDRALAFRLEVGQDTESLRRQIRRIELWRCDLLLEGAETAFPLNCAGTLYPGRNRGEFLFRYRDVPEAEHRKLFDFIKNNGGVRERI